MKKRIWIILYFFLLSGLATLKGEEVDSVRMIASKMPHDTTRLEFIRQHLLSGNRVSEKGLRNAYFLMGEAQAQKDIKYEAYAIFICVKYFYTNNQDSMHYWIQRGEPIFRKAHMYEELCRMKGWYIYSLTRSGKNEQALQAVKNLKDLAVELNYPDGKDMANQALADFYIRNSLNKEGCSLYEEILKEITERGAPVIKRVYILRQLLNLHSDHNVRLKYLKILKEYIDDGKKQGLTGFDEENPFYALEYVYYRNTAQSYIHLNKFSEAYDYILKAKKIINANQMNGVDNEMFTLWFEYYRMTGNYQKALNICDSLQTFHKKHSNVVAYMDVLNSKTYVYKMMGRYKDAYECSQELITLKDTVQQETYYKNLADMKALHENDKLVIANKEMELQASHARAQSLVFAGGLILFILICILLGYVAWSRHRYGKTLEIAKIKAEESDRLKTTFLANMNHEIRTPLNAIVGFSQVLVDEEDKAVRQELSEIIQSNNELLQRLISDVMDISKVESDMIDFNYSDVNLPALVKEIYNVILLRMPQGVELRLMPGEDINLYIDKNRLTQILTNFLTNAAKHTEKGYICFGYEVVDEEIRFDVKDTGVGIPEEQFERIFSRFVKLTEWTTGVGLGLAISKALTTKMGGRIVVASKVGEGSTFSVLFPLHR